MRAVRLLVLASLQLMAGGATAQMLSEKELQHALAPRTIARERAQVDALVRKLVSPGREQPMWPVNQFLAAELLLESDRRTEAAERYAGLVEYAASDPYKDTWGANGLVAFALYRWLGLQDEAGRPDPAALRRMSQRADVLLQTRLVRSAFEVHPILPSLPLLEEETLYRLAAAAKRAGLKGLAGRYFLSYLSCLRSVKPLAELDPLYDLVVEEGISTPDRIALFRGRRLWQLGERSEALPYLRQAADSRDEQVQLEGSYLLARASRSLSRSQKQQIYDEVHRYARDDLAQEALYWNALQFGPEDSEFRRMLRQLIREYGSGRWRDDALFWLAKGEQIAGDLDASLPYYERLRAIQRDNNYVDRSALFPALALIFRGAPGDAGKARDILGEFVDKQPDSRNRPLAQFWLGRIAEDRGDTTEADRMFERTREVNPLGYYGLRARMHLTAGRAARGQTLIRSSDLRRKLRSKYRQAGGVTRVANGSVYSRRVEASLENGLYRLALDGERQLRALDASKRLQAFTFDELDELGMLTRLAVMMALRQDALAAGALSDAVADRVALARRLGAGAEDWPAAMTLVHPTALRLASRRADLMESPGYLVSAYPKVYADLMTSATDGRGVLPAILYAVMRQEAFFYPAALSRAGALGLFQFMPNTFKERDKEWGLLTAAVPDRQSFLLDPRRSLGLGSRWFQEKKLPAFDQQPLWAILAHHSGDTKVRTWRRIWTERGWLDDLELMVESFRKPELDPGERVGAGAESRQFARQVMGDIALVEALGLYQGER